MNKAISILAVSEIYAYAASTVKAKTKEFKLHSSENTVCVENVHELSS